MTTPPTFSAPAWWIGWHRLRGGRWHALVSGRDRTAVEQWLEELIEAGQTVALPLGEEPTASDTTRTGPPAADGPKINHPQPTAVAANGATGNGLRKSEPDREG